jgi:hypothetical protein
MYDERMVAPQIQGKTVTAAKVVDGFVNIQFDDGTELHITPRDEVSITIDLYYYEKQKVQLYTTK